MKKIKKWFTIIELIVTITILAILSWLWISSMSIISESSIKNKLQNSLTFISDIKAILIKNINDDIYFYIDSSNDKNSYLLGYQKISECLNINLDDQTFFSNYKLFDDWYTEFEPTFASSVNILIKEIHEHDVKFDIQAENSNYLHKIDWTKKYEYKIYEWNTHCWNMYSFFINDWEELKYKINKIIIKNNSNDIFSTWAVIKYSKSNIKPELYLLWETSRTLYNNLNFEIIDTQNNLLIEWIIH